MFLDSYVVSKENYCICQDLECIKELRKFLIEKTHKKLESLLNDTSNHIGLLLNERFINIPPQVAVPLLENLRYD